VEHASRLFHEAVREQRTNDSLDMFSTRLCIDCFRNAICPALSQTRIGAVSSSPLPSAAVPFSIESSIDDETVSTKQLSRCVSR
jgi:hypothetical protein